MSKSRILACGLVSMTLVVASAPARAQDMLGAIAGMAIGALTGQQQGYGARPYPRGYGQDAYGAGYGYGSGYDGAYGRRQDYGYDRYGAGYGGASYGEPSCRIVAMRGTDAYGNVVVQRRRQC